MVGPSELLLILVVVLIIVLVVRGPKVLPQFGEAIGKTIKGFRDNMGDDSDKPDNDTAADTTATDTKADSVATDQDDVDTKPGA